MLQGIQTKECHPGNVLGSGINPYNATGISRIILGIFLRIIMIGKIAVRDDGFSSPK
jgi:hypothetical protein